MSEPSTPARASTGRSCFDADPRTDPPPTLIFALGTTAQHAGHRPRADILAGSDHALADFSTPPPAAALTPADPKAAADPTSIGLQSVAKGASRTGSPSVCSAKDGALDASARPCVHRVVLAVRRGCFPASSWITLRAASRDTAESRSGRSDFLQVMPIRRISSLGTAFKPVPRRHRADDPERKPMDRPASSRRQSPRLPTPCQVRLAMPVA